jgi:hypothetical protein
MQYKKTAGINQTMIDPLSEGSFLPLNNDARQTSFQYKKDAIKIVVSPG